MKESIRLTVVQLFGSEDSMPYPYRGKDKLLALDPSRGNKYLLWVNSTYEYRKEDEILVTANGNEWLSMSNVRLGRSTQIQEVQSVAKHSPND